MAWAAKRFGLLPGQRQVLSTLRVPAHSLVGYTYPARSAAGITESQLGVHVVPRRQPPSTAAREVQHRVGQRSQDVVRKQSPKTASREVQPGLARPRSADAQLRDEEARVLAPADKCVFRSAAETSSVSSNTQMPDMSLDGGSEVEFQEYWRINANPFRPEGAWIEYCSHPQVNAEPYWFNSDTGDIRWQRPSIKRLGGDYEASDDLATLAGVGPVWEMSIGELKHHLASGGEDHGQLSYAELAARAVSEYEAFQPRVLSWHDFQHNTFWFFGGMKRKPAAKGSRSFFNGRGGGASKELFASPAFFEAAAEVILERMARMHPINLTYFVWTFTRAEVRLPNFMNAIGHHLCTGRIPMMDRCSLGTMVWNFAKQGVRHDRFFEAAATELSRPNRVRSLAPRNFQNTFIAYGRRRHWNAQLFDALAGGMQRLLDEHEDPPGPKLERSLCFAYTCKDGFEVLADSWRISGLTAVLRTFHNMSVAGRSIEDCIRSMAFYVQRCVRHSQTSALIDRSKAMHGPGDACSFMLELIHTSMDVPRLNIDKSVESLRGHLPQIIEGATARSQEQLQRALRDWSSHRKMSANGIRKT